MPPHNVATMDTTKKLLFRLAVMLMLVTRVWAQHMCGHCNCQISSLSDSQAIYSLSLVCYTGTITWFGASGAVRLELMPLILGNFRACFLVHSENTLVKISHESQHISSAQNYRLKLGESRTLKLDHLLTFTDKSNEFCVNSKGAGPLLLYIEVVRTPGMEAVPKVMIRYDLEKLDARVAADPMDECRPCTKEELLDSYCSMDFVVIGKMADVTHNDASDRSDITVHAKQIIHQREQHLFQRANRSDTHLTGSVTAPRKCGIRQGEGDLILTGRYRLNSLVLRCAAYLHDWRKVQHEVECSHD